MTGTSSSRGSQLALAGIAFGAFLLRVFPFFGPEGAWTYRVDYDEGVYFSTASLLLDGVVPYRDFVFVHPPGLVVFLSLTSWTRSLLGIDGAFALSRWIAAMLGTINVVLVAKLVWRAPNAKWAALFAAALYATYPELVQVERGPFLEPLLNFVCLSLALAVVRASSGERGRWVLFAGALAGLAISIKLWALVWVLGALWAVSTFATRRELLQFIGAAAVTCALVVLPFAIQAPEHFVTQVGLFHLWRPPDGLTDRLPRLGQIFALRHFLSPILASVMIVLLIARRDLTAINRLVATAWVLTFAAFLSSPSYWPQYNAHLIASEAVLAGILLSCATPHLLRRPPLGFAMLALLLVSLSASVFLSIRRSEGDDRHLLLARSPLKTTPDCVFTFEPGWSLAAGRLPPGKPPIVDTYAHQLLGAVSGGRRFPDSTSAFAANPASLEVIEQCQNVVLGERGRRQLSPAQLERLSATHVSVEISGLEVWQRRPEGP